MTATAWILAGILPLSVGLCVWAYLTGRPGPDYRHELVRAPEHSKANREQVTRRLRAPYWIPPMERPGGEAQPLPPPDGLPWPTRRRG